MSSLKKYLYSVLFILSAIVLTVHMMALKFFLYWSIPWLDIVMHTAGGIVVSVSAVLVFFHAIETDLTPSLKFFITYGVFYPLLIGVSWELFELFSGISIVEDGLLYDTLGDLTMDVAGGLFGVWFTRFLGTRAPRDSVMAIQK